MSQQTFDADYFRRQYGNRPWRASGSKPLLDASRLRLLRRWVSRGKLLDIGVGYGALARRATEWFEVIGLDLDPEVVHRAITNSSAVGLTGSALQLPLRSESIDAITCVDVVEHLPDPDSCFVEAHRVLRPGGYFHISTPNPASFGAKRKGKESFIYRDATHCSVLSIDVWRAKLEAAGFEEVWSGTDGLWDVPYFSWIPKRLQWLLFVGATQLAWSVAPAFPWQRGENFLWLGRRRP